MCQTCLHKNFKLSGIFRIENLQNLSSKFKKHDSRLQCRPNLVAILVKITKKAKKSLRKLQKIYI